MAVALGRPADQAEEVSHMWQENTQFCHGLYPKMSNTITVQTNPTGEQKHKGFYVRKIKAVN